MSDLISRQDAIDAVVRESQVDGAYGYMDTKSIVDLLHDMSTIKAQKTGHWIPWKAYYGKDRKSWSDELKCSECGYKWGDEEYRFCPNCGAKMMEE